MGRRNEYRSRSGIGRNVERVLGQAQQEVCACGPAAPQFVSRRRIDADGEAVRSQRPDRILKMAERRVRPAADVDHVGAGRAHGGGAVEDLVDRQRRRIDDLGKDAHVMAGEVKAAGASTEIGGEILQLVRAALEGDIERFGEAREVHAAAAGQDDAIGIDRPLQASDNDRFGHQGRHLHADVED